ncbi:hypothetical protein BDZ97DRAFT_1836417 [Flammula alnicola]|nr:hypothetical protein BDZ97DRAFT_1836417 [Flammula alnicola]
MFSRLFCILSLVFSVVVASNVPSIEQRDGLSINPPLSSILQESRRGIAIPQLTARELTNARRLAAGLPLNPPRRRASRTHVARAAPSGSVLASGYIEALRVDDGSSIGYVGSTYNSFGEARIVDPAAETPMVFSIPTNVAGPFDIGTVNGPNSLYPFFGGIQGFSSTDVDIGSGSYNYVYLGSTVDTSVDSTPIVGGNTFTVATGISEAVESSIWTFNAKDHNLTPQWINSDLSMQIGSVGYFESTLLFTADPTTFTETFGPGAVWVDLKFVTAI